MQTEVRAIMKSCLQFSWYMRGGVNFIDAMNMSTDQRDILNEIVKENLETTKKSQMPFF